MTEITKRLHDLGQQPLSERTRAEHLQRIAAATPAPPRRWGRLAVAAAAMVGFLAGSTGLAMAGALPDPAQDVAHDVLSVVRVDVPEGTRGQCVRAAATDATLTKDQKRAAKDQCPKGGPPAVGTEGGDDGPGQSGTAPGRTKVDKHADDPCRGRPAWAGRTDLTPEDKAALEAERAATCGPDDEAGSDDDNDEPDDETPLQPGTTEAPGG